MITPNGTIAALNRPGFPWGTAHTSTRNNKSLWRSDRPIPEKYEIPMAWHHMIPWRCLRDGWSALASSGRWDVLSAWIETWAVGTATDTLITAMKTSALGVPQNSDMHNKLCWAQYNLVEGPEGTYRNDDPGSEHFDAFEGRNVTGNVKQRSQILKSVYSVIKTWDPTFAMVPEKDAKTLIQDFRKLRSLRTTPITMFDPKLWVLNVKKGDHEAKFDKNDNAIRHPHWIKAA